MAKQRSRSARRAAGDLFAFELLHVFDVFLADQEEQWFCHGEKHNLHRPALDRGADGAGDRAIVIDVAVQHGGARQVGRHKDDFQVETFVFEETTVHGSVEGEE